MVRSVMEREEAIMEVGENVTGLYNSRVFLLRFFFWKFSKSITWIFKDVIFRQEVMI